MSEKLTKNQRRRKKRKEKKQIDHQVKETQDKNSESKKDPLENVQVEYVSEELTSSDVAPELLHVFEKFASAELLCKNPDYLEKLNAEEEKALEAKKLEDEKNALAMVEEEGDKVLSKKMKKKMSRLTVAELKQLVPRADIVEAHDVTALDPKLLVALKAYRNTVPVPRHWCDNRRYLQGKRGIDKHTFVLPEFIAQTGIGEIRSTLLEDDSMKNSSQRAREKLQPKMGRMDIDYQVLHDAFFKYQTKPKMSEHGDLYYEGKEFEIQMKSASPGNLTDTLKLALGMTDGVPPPWLLHMQRYGPPPAYPKLKIPGLNAPIPTGSSFGYHPGGWGKPPVDEFGRPLYGDVFAKATIEEEPVYDVTISKEKWGAIDVLQAESEEEEEVEDNEEDEYEDEPETGHTASSSGIATPLMSEGISSVASSVAVPEVVNMRKEPKTLYTVLGEKPASSDNKNALYGSSIQYETPGTATQPNDGFLSTASSKRKAEKSELEQAKSKKYKNFKF